MSTQTRAKDVQGMPINGGRFAAPAHNADDSVVLGPDMNAHIDAFQQHILSTHDNDDLSYEGISILEEALEPDSVEAVLNECDELYPDTARGRTEAEESYRWRLVRVHERRARAENPSKEITSKPDFQDVYYGMNDRATLAGQSLGASMNTKKSNAYCSGNGYIATMEVDTDGTFDRRIDGTPVKAFTASHRKAQAMESYVESEKESMMLISEALQRGFRL